jgi:iron complex transport system substrate-binding protein
MKICSLLPSGTEILYALGLEDSIAGVSDLCDYPPRVKEKPAVSRSKVDPSVLSSDEVEQQMLALLERGEDPYELDLAWLERESPDVILTQDLCHVCEIDADGVNATVRGMAVQPTVVVLRPTTFGEILESIVQVGEACGGRDAGLKLASSLRERAGAVVDRAAQAASKPRVFSLEGINPLVIGGHWIPEMLRMAGGDQAMLEPGCAARRLDWREVLGYAPEKLFVDLCSSDIARNLREVPWLAAQEGWDAIPAVAAGEVYLIDHAYFSRPGPRVIEGLEILAQLTHPDLFTGLIPPGTVAKLDPQAAACARPEDIAACFVPL